MKVKIIPVIILILTSFLLFVYLLFLNYYKGQIYPGVSINHIPVDSQSSSLTHQLLTLEFNKRQNALIKINFEHQTFNLNLASASPQLNLDEVVKEAYLVGRSGNYIKDLTDQFQAVVWGINITPALYFQKGAVLISQINQINQLIKKEAVDAKISLGEEVSISPSAEGLELDSQVLLAQVKDYLNLTSHQPTALPTKITKPTFITADAKRYKKLLDNIKISPIKLKFEDRVWVIDQKTLLSLLDFKSTNSQAVLNQDKLSLYLKEIADKIDREAQDAKFTVDLIGTRPPAQIKVREFLPSLEGKKLDTDKTTVEIIDALTNTGPKEITLPVVITQPKITTDRVNDFGIKELLGQGSSYFAGSIENRIYNINLAASKLNGTLIPLSEIFSFNNTVGDISASSGYKQAYVIKSGRTVLDDGGGVCQVSTTLFRAILNSGLPIVERTAHAYRVGYYEQKFPPGLDATVFAPTVDLKFKNDTSKYILIQAYTYGLSLYINIYGTSDGRITTLSAPVVTNQTPPPPELRQDDPGLPKGSVKQVDWPAWGANVVFTRVVKRGSETLISETFKSFYKPWQAVYLVGTKE